MGTAPAFASVGEAIETARAALGYLAAADAAQFAAQTQAECLRGLEQTDAIATAARASFLSAFTAGKGYSADADYSARAWLMHRTGITRGAAASRTAWANRAGTHPAVVAALAAGEVSESYGRAICRWTDRLPEKFREESDELLVKAATAGLSVHEHVHAGEDEMFYLLGGEMEAFCGRTAGPSPWSPVWVWVWVWVWRSMCHSSTRPLFQPVSRLARGFPGRCHTRPIESN